MHSNHGRACRLFTVFTLRRVEWKYKCFHKLVSDNTYYILPSCSELPGYTFVFDGKGTSQDTNFFFLGWEPVDMCRKQPGRYTQI